ncbi:MAG: PIG-L family deacetylase [Candidatus Bathyarchaeia archaeon]
MEKKLVVFAPHPDDEALGCGGTLSKRISEGWEIFIVFVTCGENALSDIFGISFNPSPAELKAMRINEAYAAAKVLGVHSENLIFFNFEDGKVCYHKERLRKEALLLLKRLEPTEVYFPYERDVNIDHAATSEIIAYCIREINKTILHFKYSIATKFSRLSPLLARVLNPILHNVFYVDVSGFIQKKREIINEYKSQIGIISDRQERPVITDVSRFLKNREMFFT